METNWKTSGPSKPLVLASHSSPIVFHVSCQELGGRALFLHNKSHPYRTPSRKHDNLALVAHSLQLIECKSELKRQIIIIKTFRCHILLSLLQTFEFSSLLRRKLRSLLDRCRLCPQLFICKKVRRIQPRLRNLETYRSDPSQDCP